MLEKQDKNKTKNSVELEATLALTKGNQHKKQRLFKSENNYQGIFQEWHKNWRIWGLPVCFLMFAVWSIVEYSLQRALANMVCHNFGMNATVTHLYIYLNLFIPGNEICLYLRVGKQFFFLLETGSFTVGTSSLVSCFAGLLTPWWFMSQFSSSLMFRKLLKAL